MGEQQFLILIYKTDISIPENQSLPLGKKRKEKEGKKKSVSQ